MAAEEPRAFAGDAMGTLNAELNGLLQTQPGRRVSALQVSSSAKALLDASREGVARAAASVSRYLSRAPRHCKLSGVYVLDAAFRREGGPEGERLAVELEATIVDALEALSDVSDDHQKKTGKVLTEWRKHGLFRGSPTTVADLEGLEGHFRRGTAAAFFKDQFRRRKEENQHQDDDDDDNQSDDSGHHIDRLKDRHRDRDRAEKEQEPPWHLERRAQIASSRGGPSSSGERAHRGAGPPRRDFDDERRGGYDGPPFYDGGPPFYDGGPPSSYGHNNGFASTETKKDYYSSVEEAQAAAAYASSSQGGDLRRESRWPQRQRGATNAYGPASSTNGGSRSANAPANHPQLAKTRMCRSITLGLPCRFGANCTFAHSAAEIRRAPPRPLPQDEPPPFSFKQQQPPAAPPPPIAWCPLVKANWPPLDKDDGGLKWQAHLRKTKLCKYFVSNGDCPFGEKCNFAHGDADIAQAEKNQEKNPQPPRTHQPPYGGPNHYGPPPPPFAPPSFPPLPRPPPLFPPPNQEEPGYEDPAVERGRGNPYGGGPHSRLPPHHGPSPLKRGPPPPPHPTLPAAPPGPPPGAHHAADNNTDAWSDTSLEPTDLASQQHHALVKRPKLAAG